MDKFQGGLQVPGQHSQRTKSSKTVVEIIPFYFKYHKRTKTLCLGEKPASIPKGKILTKREMRQIKSKDSDVYVNPITKAKEYEKILENKGVIQTILAKDLGFSRTRLTQVLNLLKLPQERQDYILEHGKEEMLTERKLRKMIWG